MQPSSYYILIAVVAIIAFIWGAKAARDNGSGCLGSLFGGIMTVVSIPIAILCLMGIVLFYQIMGSIGGSTLSEEEAIRLEIKEEREAAGYDTEPRLRVTGVPKVVSTRLYPTPTVEPTIEEVRDVEVTAQPSNATSGGGLGAAIERIKEPTAQDAGGVQSHAPSGTPAWVTNIVDGDTIDVIMEGAEYRVRYILVDTPERDMPYFEEATEANRALVDGKTVYLVKDVSETDRYGRLLRYVYLEDGTFVNEELVRQGYALVATFPPDVAMQELISDAEGDAWNHSRGLWALSDQDAPIEDVEEPEQPTDDIAELNRLAAEQPHLLDTVANTRANIRSGPGTNFPVDRVVDAGTGLLIIGQNAAGDWLQIDPGFWWISRDLVDGAESVTWPIADTTPIIEEQVSDPVPEDCDPAYPDVCVPPFSLAGDLDCREVPHLASFRVLPPDPHGFDGEDNDGLGCEGN